MRQNIKYKKEIRKKYVPNQNRARSQNATAQIHSKRENSDKCTLTPSSENIIRVRNVFLSTI